MHSIIYISLSYHYIRSEKQFRFWVVNEAGICSLAAIMFTDIVGYTALMGERWPKDGYLVKLS